MRHLIFSKTVLSFVSLFSVVFLYNADYRNKEWALFSRNIIPNKISAACIKKINQETAKAIDKTSERCFNLSSSLLSLLFVVSERPEELVELLLSRELEQKSPFFVQTTLEKVSYLLLNDPSWHAQDKKLEIFKFFRKKFPENLGLKTLSVELQLYSQEGNLQQLTPKLFEELYRVFFSKVFSEDFPICLYFLTPFLNIGFLFVMFL